MNFAVADVLEAWDILKTFTSYKRTPKRVEWLRSSYEIQGSVDEWLENKAANVVDEYSKLKKISFDEAQRELMDRPTKPWKEPAKPERKKYVVHVTWRHPAWDEKDGADIETEARSKSEACKYIRSEMRNRGHVGVMYFKATEAR